MAYGRQHAAEPAEPRAHQPLPGRPADAGAPGGACGGAGHRPPAPGGAPAEGGPDSAARRVGDRTKRRCAALDLGHDAGVMPKFRFALLLACLGCATSAPPATLTSPTAPPVTAEAQRVPFVYVAGYRPEILIFRLDQASGKLTPVGSADGGREPSFLAWDPGGPLPVRRERGGRGAGAGLRHRSGDRRADPAERSALGRVRPRPSVGGPRGQVRAGGQLRPRTPGHHRRAAHRPRRPPGATGRPPRLRRGDHAPLHHRRPQQPLRVRADARAAPTWRRCASIRATGQLEPNRPARVASAPRAGPRHMDFHPNHRFAYVINEQAMTLTAYAFDQNKGTLAEIESLPTVPADIPASARKDFSTADIHVHPSGKLLYGSNRGHNSIVIFKVDDSTGRLTLVGHETRHIARPRNFHIDPIGLAAVRGQPGRGHRHRVPHRRRQRAAGPGWAAHAGRGQALVRRGGDAAGSMTDCTVVTAACPDPAVAAAAGRRTGGGPDGRPGARTPPWRPGARDG